MCVLIKLPVLPPCIRTYPPIHVHTFSIEEKGGHISYSTHTHPYMYVHIPYEAHVTCVSVLTLQVHIIIAPIGYEGNNILLLIVRDSSYIE